MPQVFYFSDTLPLEPVVPGLVSRKVGARGGRMMMVEVSFCTGGVGAEHAHPHEQATYCLKGEFLFTIGSEVRTIRSGDSVYIPAEVVHGARCLSAGVLLDVFTPQREDFLNSTNTRKES